MNFQDIITKLDRYWARQGCALLPPGAASWPARRGPFNLAGAAAQPVSDGLCGRYRYRVFLSPSPDNARRLFLASLDAAGLARAEHDLRWQPAGDDGPRCGWEVLLDGLPLGRFFYRSPGAVEAELSLERLALAVQKKRSVEELCWAGRLTYGELHPAGEAA